MKYSSGFGLLEVLIAAGILALIVGAAVALATSSLSNSVLSANRTVAGELAQEGVELVRQMRDTSYVDGPAVTSAADVGQANAWSSYFNLAACLGAARTCGLAKDDLTKRWSLVDGLETIPVVSGVDATTTFTREIRLESVDALAATIPSNPGGVDPLALTVTSTVRWADRGRTLAATAATVLTDWRASQ